LVYGKNIAIKNEKLYGALAQLETDKRDIILLSHFLDMSDSKIAKKLKQARSTVQNHRTSSLIKLREIMEVRK
jgi:DNA-directed RNA polymerase specialized sigma24 family protein